MGDHPRTRLAAVAASAVIAAASGLVATDAAAQFDFNRVLDLGSKLYQDHLDQQRRVEEEQRRERERRKIQQRPPSQQQVRQPRPYTPSPPPDGPTRTEVQEAQERLNALGYDAGPADGLMGPRTASAIEEFQRDHAMPADGRVSADLIAGLRAAPSYTQDSREAPEESSAAWRPPGGGNAPTAPPLPDAGPGLVPVDAVFQDGHLLTGYPLLFGRHKSGDTDRIRGYRIASHLELARLVDLMILAARPAILDDPRTARDYAVRFLGDDMQKRFLAECPYGSCGGSKIPFVGWSGDNEFEREATYRRFVTEYRDRLRAMAPAAPPPLLEVVEMEVQPYDRDRRAFPLKVRRGAGIIATVPTAYRLKVAEDFSPPTTVPVPPAEGGAFLARTPQRLAYLALKGTLTPFTDSPYGKGVDSSFAVRSATLYADPELTQELHAFDLFSEGGKAVAASTLGSGADRTGVNGMRTISGPGGVAMLELPLPEGLKPLRYMALHDLPVTGAPVRSHGALSPASLKQRHGHAPDIETDVGRLVDLMRVATQPKLLEGVGYAEEFIDNQADETTYRHFYPDRRAVRNTFHFPFGTNEFERQDLHREVKRRYMTAALPKPPFELLHVEDIRLGDYDARAGRFALSDPSGGGAGIGPLVERQGYLPDGFPMAQAQARALLDRLPSRRVYIAYHVALTGVGLQATRDAGVSLALRGMTVYEDELLTKPLHTFPVESHSAPQATLAPMRNLNAHLASLYEVRDIQDWMTQGALLKGAARLVQAEQTIWRQATDGRACNGKATVFEWDRARRAAPDLATGPLLSALMGMPMDWGFLNTQTRFGLVPDHCVAVTVFRREQVEGREPEFAAREVVDVYRASVEAAAKAAPKTVYVADRLPKARYDHASGTLVFPPESASSRDKPWSPATLYHIDRTAPVAEAGDRPSSRIAYVEPGMEGRVFYSLSSGSDTTTVGDHGPKPRSLGNGDIGETWRQTLWSVTDDTQPRRVIALDRRLELPRLPMDRAAAEKIVASRDRLTAIIRLDIDRAQASPANGGSMLFASLGALTVVGPDGPIATIAPSAFTSGQTLVDAAQAEDRAKAAEAAAKQKAQEDQKARLATVLNGHKGAILVRRANDAGPITTVYTSGGSSGIGYTYTVRDKNLDLPAKGVAVTAADMAKKLQSEPGAAVLTDDGTFGRSIFPETAGLDLVVSAWPPAPKPLAADLAAALDKQIPDGAKVVLVRAGSDRGPLETVYSTTSATQGAHLNQEISLHRVPDYATVDSIGKRENAGLRDVPDLLRDGRNVGALLEPDGLRAIYDRLAPLKPTIVRFPVAEYSFGIEKDHTRTAADYDILGIAGGAPEAAALAAIGKEFTPGQIHHDTDSGEIRAGRGACDGPMAAPPAADQQGAYCLRVRVDGGKVVSVALRQVVPGSMLDGAVEAFKKRYGWSPFFTETRYFPGAGQRILLGFGGRLDTDREALGRVAAGTPPTALETIAWADDGTTAVLLQLDDALTTQEAVAASKPKLKF